MKASLVPKKGDSWELSVVATGDLGTGAGRKLAGWWLADLRGGRRVVGRSLARG